MPEISSTFIILCIAAYLIGSVSTAIIVCKIMKLPDPRTLGSNNPGATNVLRIGGKKAAAITLLGDALKGFIPVLIALLLHQNVGNLAIIGFLAFIGHLYPVFFQFKGGKGVATALGVMLALSLPVGGSLLVTWLLIAYVFKISSFAALIAACLSPFYMWIWEGKMELVIMSVIISVLLLWRHRANIKQLLSGTEGKI